MKAVFGQSRRSEEGGEEWISVSDLMAGLMMVFMFISVSLMRHAMIERDQIKEVAVAYQENQVAIYDSLMEEFSNDLERWGAEIDPDTLSFNFKSPEVLFENGKTTLRPEFEVILADFFPRYLDVLYRYLETINEVRIEGHTSSRWNDETSVSDAYFLNMRLSQGRTRSVLYYVSTLPDPELQMQHAGWIRKHVAAVGYSSSRLVYNEDGSENESKSRRVSFRVITNADTQIRKILGD